MMPRQRCHLCKAIGYRVPLLNSERVVPDELDLGYAIAYIHRRFTQTFFPTPSLKYSGYRSNRYHTSYGKLSRTLSEHVHLQIILQMIAMGVRDPRDFQFIERPSDDKLEAAIFNLQQHQGTPLPLLPCNVDLHVLTITHLPEAITSCRDGRYQLTPLGGMLSQLPVDIPVGKMLVLGSVTFSLPLFRSHALTAHALPRSYLTSWTPS